MSMRTLCTATAGTFLLALVATSGGAQAAAGPFSALAGSWSGSGVLALSNGAREPMRCRASYEVAQRGENVRLNIRCASDSFNFDLASQVASHDGKLSGEWSEASRNASGTITGRAAGRQIQALASSAGFSANLSLTTRGNRQSVEIRPNGTDVEQVTLTLNRR